MASLGMEKWIKPILYCLLLLGCIIWIIPSSKPLRVTWLGPFPPDVYCGNKPCDKPALEKLLLKLSLVNEIAEEKDGIKVVFEPAAVSLSEIVVFNEWEALNRYDGSAVDALDALYPQKNRHLSTASVYTSSVWIAACFDSLEFCGFTTSERLAPFSWTWTPLGISDLSFPTDKASVLSDMNFGEDYEAIFYKKSSGHSASYLTWECDNMCQVHTGRDAFVKELSQHLSITSLGSCLSDLTPAHGSSKKLSTVERAKVVSQFKFDLILDHEYCSRDPTFLDERISAALVGNTIPVVLSDIHEDRSLTYSDNGMLIAIQDFETPEDVAKFLNDLGANKEKYIGKLRAAKSFFRRWIQERNQPLLYKNGTSFGSTPWSRLLLPVSCVKPHVLPDGRVRYGHYLPSLLTATERRLINQYVGSASNSMVPCKHLERVESSTEPSVFDQLNLPRAAAQKKRVISGSLYGSELRYLTNTMKNVKLSLELFPDWILRLYVGEGIPDDILIELRSYHHVELVAPPESFPPMTWRFLAANDDTVERFIVWDLDSLLSPRIQAAVVDWIDSGLPGLIMRDHPSHSLFRISGGLWGGMPGLIPDIHALLEANKVGTGYVADMKFMGEAVWPFLLPQTLQIDSHSCFDPQYTPLESSPGRITFPSVSRNGLEHLGQVHFGNGLPREGDMNLLIDKDQPPECMPQGDLVHRLKLFMGKYDNDMDQLLCGDELDFIDARKLVDFIGLYPREACIRYNQIELALRQRSRDSFFLLDPHLFQVHPSPSFDRNPFAYSFGGIPDVERTTKWPFVSQDGLEALAGYVYHGSHSKLSLSWNPSNLPRGAVIAVRGQDAVASFFQLVHPKITHSYVLITLPFYALEGHMPGKKYKTFSEDPKILAWFTTHCLEDPSTASRVVPLPMGLTTKSQVDKIVSLRRMASFAPLDTHHRDLLIIVILSRVDRDKYALALSHLRKQFHSSMVKIVYDNDVLTAWSLLALRAQYVIALSRSELSQHGFWEAIIYGVIPIVLNTFESRVLLSSSPTVFVDDWIDLTATTLSCATDALLSQVAGKKEYPIPATLNLATWVTSLQNFQKTVEMQNTSPQEVSGYVIGRDACPKEDTSSTYQELPVDTSPMSVSPLRFCSGSPLVNPSDLEELQPLSTGTPSVSVLFILDDAPLDSLLEPVASVLHQDYQGRITVHVELTKRVNRRSLSRTIQSMFAPLKACMYFNGDPLGRSESSDNRIAFWADEEALTVTQKYPKYDEVVCKSSGLTTWQPSKLKTQTSIMFNDRLHWSIMNAGDGNQVKYAASTLDGVISAMGEDDSGCYLTSVLHAIGGPKKAWRWSDGVFSSDACLNRVLVNTPTLQGGFHSSPLLMQALPSQLSQEAEDKVSDCRMDTVLQGIPVAVIYEDQDEYTLKAKLRQWGCCNCEWIAVRRPDDTDSVWHRQLVSEDVSLAWRPRMRKLYASLLSLLVTFQTLSQTSSLALVISDVSLLTPGSWTGLMGVNELAKWLNALHIQEWDFLQLGLPMDDDYKKEMVRKEFHFLRYCSQIEKAKNHMASDAAFLLSTTGMESILSKFVHNDYRDQLSNLWLGKRTNPADCTSTGDLPSCKLLTKAFFEFPNLFSSTATALYANVQSSHMTMMPLLVSAEMKNFLDDSGMGSRTKLTKSCEIWMPDKTKPKVYKQLEGRLGNQLFQFASMYGIAHETGIMPVFHCGADTEYGVAFSYAGLIGLFENEHLFPPCENFDQGYEWILESKGYATFDPAIADHIQDAVHSKGELRQVKTYLQSWYYFDSIASTIRQLFVFNKSIRETAASFIKPIRDQALSLAGSEYTLVGMHVRRGDFVTAKDRRVPKNQYYQHAMSYMRGKYKNVHFIVATEETAKDWVKSFSEFDFPYVHVLPDSDLRTPAVDMQILRGTDHMILGPASTYGWWAGWLSDGEVIFCQDPQKVDGKPLWPAGLTVDQYFLPFWTSRNEDYVKIQKGTGKYDDSVLGEEVVESSRLQADWPIFADSIDVVFVTTPYDVHYLEPSILGALRNVVRLRNIWILSRQHPLVLCLAERMNEHEDALIRGIPVRFLDENRFPFNKSNIIPLLMTSDKNRFGWLYQQLAKLYAPYYLPDPGAEGVLVIDSDTTWVHPIAFSTAAATPLRSSLVAIGDYQFHKAYFVTMYVMTANQVPRRVNETGIAHHGYYDVNILEDLHRHVSQWNGGLPLWKAALLSLYRGKDGSKFSEYELYFNFAIKFHEESIRVWHPKYLEVSFKALSVDEVTQLTPTDTSFVSRHKYLDTFDPRIPLHCQVVLDELADYCAGDDFLS